MSDLHKVHFTWPSTSPGTVTVTGTFDDWSSSVPLVKDETGFHGSTFIPWDSKILYKFVVDSNWVCSDGATETDSSGFTNNVYTSPPKPVAEPVSGAASPEAAVTNGSATQEKEAEVADPASKAENAGLTGIDLVETVVASDGTSTALGYVASGLGAAIQTQIGVDPINSEKVPVETPEPNAVSESTPTVAPEPTPVVSEPAPAAAPEPSSMAPDVPISIVPVNSENQPAHTETTVTPPAVAPAPIGEPEQPPITPSTHQPLPAVAPEVEHTETSPTPATLPATAPEPVVSETTSSPAEATESATKNDAPTSPPAVPTSTSAATPSPARPSTPAQHTFPSGDTDSIASSTTKSPSKYGTVASRQKRKSIFRRITGIFGSDKEKGEKEAK